MLRSERLVLQPWSEGDLDDALTLWSHPEVMRLLGGPLSREKIEARLAHEMNNQRTLGFQYWRVTHENSFVGCCGLKHTPIGEPSGARRGSSEAAVPPRMRPYNR